MPASARSSLTGFSRVITRGADSAATAIPYPSYDSLRISLAAHICATSGGAVPPRTAVPFASAFPSLQLSLLWGSGALGPVGGLLPTGYTPTTRPEL